jgi:hypothetical protein
MSKNIETITLTNDQTEQVAGGFLNSANLANLSRPGVGVLAPAEPSIRVYEQAARGSGVFQMF